MKIFETIDCNEIVWVFSLSTKEFRKWVAEEDTTLLQPVVGVLRTKVQGQTGESFASIFAIRDHSLLCEAGMEQAWQALRAGTAARTCATSDGRVSE